MNNFMVKMVYIYESIVVWLKCMMRWEPVVDWVECSAIKISRIQCEKSQISI